MLAKSADRLKGIAPKFKPSERVRGFFLDDMLK
jgi:hypothetical protein